MGKNRKTEPSILFPAKTHLFNVCVARLHPSQCLLVKIILRK